MLSINTTPAVPWPVTTGSAVQPVVPVTAPSPVQRSTGDPRQSAGDGRGSAPASPSVRVSTTQPREADEAVAAPLLPRERPPEQQEAELDQARQEEVERAREAESQRLPPQQLLSTVWEASAAVVNQVLGEEPAAATPAAADAATDAVPVKLAADPGAEAQDLVSYDERGNGESAPVELGVIISERA